MEYSVASVAPGQRQYHWTQRLSEWFDRKLCGVSEWLESNTSGVLSCCCASDTDWDCVDRERAFKRRVELERGIVYGDGTETNLELALRYHRCEVGYSVRDPIPDDIPVEYESEGPGGDYCTMPGGAVLTPEQVGECFQEDPPTSPPKRNTRWRNLRRQRFALSPGIVVALADELTVKVGRMCACCDHTTLHEVQTLCPANYRAAEFAYLNIAVIHGLHPQHVRLYREPTLLEYFSDRGSGVGYGGYQGLLSNAERRRGTGGGRH
jgi:hypothetical protein